ncbi:hypothetical protein EDC01DRAFT_631451 [Geopyxis carbonaria]|nr:hypothetical protein EDC01DRAFT_631451 [Geopyxis carbonaria]
MLQTFISIPLPLSQTGFRAENHFSKAWKVTLLALVAGVPNHTKVLAEYYYATCTNSVNGRHGRNVDTMVKSSPYPRAVLKSTIKAHSSMGVSRNTDIYAYLDYVLFVQELIREASIRARARGAAGGRVSAADVQTASEF